MSGKKIKIVALGDSITFGFPYSPKDSWVEAVRLATKIEIINKGVNGDTTGDMLKRFRKDVISENPSHVIILGGANDVSAAVDKEIVLDNLKTMCNLSTESKIIPIIGLPTPINEQWGEYRLSGYRGLMRGYAEEKGYIMIDFYSALLEKESGGIQAGLHEDGIHPSIEGYLTMAETAINLIKEIL